MAGKSEILGPIVPSRYPSIVGFSWALVALLLLSYQPSRSAVSPQSKSEKTMGTIQGRILFRGETIPRSTVIANGTDPEFCGSHQSFEDMLISPKTRGIRNVIVALAGAEAVAASPPATTKLILRNRRCQFEPHAAVLTTGSTVEALNHDPIFHTTHLYYGSLSKNLALAVGGKASQVVSRPGFVIVKCDIHGWMKAFIRVDPHPFHAVSDAEGRFEIRDVPPGTYTLETWHESLGEQKLPVTVRAGTAEFVEIAYSK